MVEDVSAKKALMELKDNKIRTRCITEVSPDSIAHCKEILSFVHEIRHMNGINDCFWVSEKAIAFSSSSSHCSAIPQLTITNNTLFVKHHQRLFDMMWSKASPFIQRVEEIENKSKKTITKVLEDPIEIGKVTDDFIRNSDELNICSTIEMMKLVYNKFYDLHGYLIEKQKKGQYKGTRWITSINNIEDVDLVRKFLGKTTKIRHVKDIPSSASFTLNNNAFYSTIDKTQGGREMISSVLSSSNPLYINHYKTIFEQMWSNAQDAEDRIRDIEKGLTDNLTLSYNPQESINVLRRWFNSAKSEILMILSSANALIRIENNKGFETLDRLASSKGVKVRVLIPMGEGLEEPIKDLAFKYHSIETRGLPFSLTSPIGTIIIDKEKVVSIELKDDLKTSFEDAIRLSIFIESKPTSLSCASIFDSLWRQTEMYEQLMINEKMQQEFIDIASHELRTPLQSIMGYSGILMNELSHVEEYKNHLEAIQRNAARIKRLINRLLDIAQFENDTLVLKKEVLDFEELMRNTLASYYKRFNEKDKAMIELRYVPKTNTQDKDENIDIKGDLVDSPVFVYADRLRITQVITNLLDNAIEFLTHNKGDKGQSGRKRVITITAEKILQKGNHGSEMQELVIKIIDPGHGIDPKILPRLFNKFVTNTSKGTGLGLYFCKKIIEAHEGRIWAQNNENKDGATFSFSLPIKNEHT